MTNYNINLSNPTFLKYFVVIVVDLFKYNPDFKEKIVNMFPDLPKQAIDFNENTSWNDSHILMFYINKNLAKFKNFLLNEYYLNNNLFSLQDFDQKYRNSIIYDKEAYFQKEIYVKPVLDSSLTEPLLIESLSWKN
jgi:hypothetical protein